MDARSEAILGACHPTLIERVHNLAAALVAGGFDPHISAGLRTIAQQNALYAVGRNGDPGKVVTDAQGCADNHVMGFAADFFFEVHGEADWTSLGFGRLAALASTYGLRSGACFRDLPDSPHVELAEFPMVPTPYMQQVYLAAGSVAEVWREFQVEQSYAVESKARFHLDVLDYATIAVSIAAFVGIVLALIHN